MNIKKQIRFLYRYFTTSRRWRRWINAQVLVVLLLSALVIAALAWSTPSPANSYSPRGLIVAAAAATRTLNPSAEPTGTPFPPEFYTNSQQTVGITLAGVILVLIVVIGVIVFMPKKVEK